MTNILLQFAKDSFLFHDKSIRTQYSRYSNSQLENELERYRQFILENTRIEQADKRNLSILVEGTNFAPDENFLKQTALYVHQIIINDPVFEFTLPRSNISKAMNKYLGMDKSGIDREDLSKAAQYVVHLKKAIRSDFIDFLPLSYLHEPPKDIPIKYSEVLFSDVLPPGILEFFLQNAKVVPLQKGDGYWFIDPQVLLTPCRAIDVSFSIGTHKSYPYMLFDIEVVSFDEKTGHVALFETLPDTPPSREYFQNWVSQSINQAARRYFDDVYKEVSLANAIGANYLTHSDFAYQLLQKSISLSSDLKSDILNLTMDLELPLLENVPLEQILDVRQKDGDSFERFRVELEKQLRELRTISEPSELSKKLENVAHELMNVQIREINEKIAAIKRKLFPDAMILVGGLVTTIQAGGFGIPALIYAIQNGYKTYQEYILGVEEKPAFFLWKVGNKKR